jgi:parallel beta-helix repeat protein
MKSRKGELLSLLIFLLMIIPAFTTNIICLPETDEIQVPEENINEEPIIESVPQYRQTRASVEREGTVLDEEYSNLLMPVFPYYSTIGWKFEVSQACTVNQLGAFKNSGYPIHYYNLRIWDSIGGTLVQVTNPTVPNKNWTWFDIPLITLSPGIYTISAYTSARNISSIHNPGPTSDGVINPTNAVTRYGNVFPWNDLGDAWLPMIDFRYTYSFTPDIIVPDDYGTIQQAIDAANIDDIIYVHENVIPYNEELTIAKTIKLMGENKTTTIIDSTGVTGGSGVTILITGNDVLLSGFTVTGGDCGIYCDSTDGADIRHNIISQNNDYGIYLDNSKNTTIKSNIISNNNQDLDFDGFGIYIIDSHVSGIRYNFISLNKVGIKIINSTIAGCLNWNTFVGNGIAVDYDPEPIEIEGNYFFGNGIAIIIWGGDSPVVIKNNVFYNNEIGVLVESGSPLIIENNFGNNEIGVKVVGVSKPIIDDNYFHGNIVDVFNPPTATIDIDPNTLNLRSKGKWITCYIELPEPYNVSDIDVDSILLNDVLSISPSKKSQFTIGDYDGDGVTDMMVKFDRQKVQELIGGPTISFDIKITGFLMDGTYFEGYDWIMAIKPRK